MGLWPLHPALRITLVLDDQLDQLKIKQGRWIHLSVSSCLVSCQILHSAYLMQLPPTS